MSDRTPEDASAWDSADAASPDVAAPGDGPLWVFAYGSLIWNPGFEVAERRLATLRDFRRSFCMSSIHHRGTEEHPGLVLALDFEEGASCRGVALRAPRGAEAAVLAYLRERELISSAYVERAVTVKTERGRVRAVAFVMAREHPQYAGGLPLEAQADVIARAVGGRGPNDEYLHLTVAALDALAIADDELTRLAAMVRDRTEREASPHSHARGRRGG